MADVDELRLLSGLLDEALDLPVPQREAWLATLCGAAAELVPTLRGLLGRAASRETAEWLDRGPSFTLAAEADAAPTFQEGDAVGPYRLLREIGRGGMGEVWLAERSDGQLKRAVALKLPLLGLRRSVLVQRFARERDILGGLAHPHIARLYDAGLADDGQPYLALEHVDGLPITLFCSEHQLHLRQRLQLLLQVMDAVQYAHGHLVIHRDLKPSNVLVTEQGQAMLLDFGIAKLLQGEGTQAAETELTQLGGRALTLDYASPEQLGGAPVSIAVDIWALGVLLYELLAGQRPFQGARREVEQAIVAHEPARPRGVPADLATVVLKALKKAPGERYATVNAFAEDLKRWLDGEPVAAQADTVWYRARRFLGRHRTATATAAAVLTLLVSASALSIWQARQARQEASRALAVQGFLLDLFRTNTADQSDPVRARQTTARELLDRGAAALRKSLLDEPHSRLILAQTLGNLYAELNLWSEASQWADEQVTLTRRLYGDSDQRMAAALVDQARALDRRARDSAREVMPLLTQAERILDASGDRDSLLRGRLHVLLADHLVERSLSEAHRHALRSVAIFRQRHAEDAGLEDALETLASVLFRQGDRQGAAATMEQALSLARLRRRSDLRMAPLLRRAGEIAAFAGQVQPAEALLRESLAMTERLHGPHGVATVMGRLSLARNLAWSARTGEARLLADRALADATAPVGGHEPFQLQETRRLVFEIYWEQGDLPACRRLLAQAFADFGPAAPDSFEHADLLIDRAMVETEDGHLARARDTLAQTVSMAQRLGLGPRSLMMRILAFQTAEQRLAAGDGHGALATLNQLEAGAEKEKVAGDAPLALRARALAASGQTEQARGLIDAELRDLRSDSNRDARAAVEAHLLLISGQLALQLDDCQAALPALERSAELYARIHVPESPQRLKVEAARSTCLVRLAATGATSTGRGPSVPR